MSQPVCRMSLRSKFERGLRSHLEIACQRSIDEYNTWRAAHEHQPLASFGDFAHGKTPERIECGWSLDGKKRRVERQRPIYRGGRGSRPHHRLAASPQNPRSNIADGWAV